MATQIKNTPILRGKDAEEFTRRMKESETKRVPSHEYNRAVAVYRRISLESSPTYELAAGTYRVIDGELFRILPGSPDY